jgi:hypothetical protein
LGEKAKKMYTNFSAGVVDPAHTWYGGMIDRPSLGVSRAAYGEIRAYSLSGNSG